MFSCRKEPNLSLARFLEGLGEDRIISNLVFKDIYIGDMDWIYLAQVTDQCKHGYESSGSIKCEDFLDELRNYELLKECRGPLSCLFSLLGR